MDKARLADFSWPIPGNCLKVIPSSLGVSIGEKVFGEAVDFGTVVAPISC
jgi:hypothetical protein